MFRKLFPTIARYVDGADAGELLMLPPMFVLTFGLFLAALYTGPLP